MVQIWEVAGSKFVVWEFVWGIVVVPHWVYGGVCDVKLECDRVGVRYGVVRGNVAGGGMALVENETKVVDVLNDVVNVAKSESGICVHDVDMEGE